MDVHHRGSLVEKATRVVRNAVKLGRLSPTEADVILDVLWHGDMPAGFKLAPAQGGFDPPSRVPFKAD